MDQVEATILLDKFPCVLASILERSNGRSDDCGTGLGELGSHETNAANVAVAVFAGEAELTGELGADVLAEEEGDGASALLVEGNVEGAGNGIFTRVGKTGEEDGETLLAARWVGFAKHTHNFGVGEPLGNLLSGPESLAELCSRDVQGADTLLDLVLRLVLIRVREVGHHLEGNDLNTELVLVLLDGILGIVRAIEFLTLGVLSGPGVVTTNNEVGRTVILTDDSVPDSLTRATHAHGKRKQTQNSHAVGVSGKQCLVHTDTREVVNVSRLGKAHDWVDEDVGLTGTGSTDGELTVSAVHGVTGLECDDLGPAKLVEVKTELCGGVCIQN